jgi:hypothetical protein
MMGRFNGQLIGKNARDNRRGLIWDAGHSFASREQQASINIVRRASVVGVMYDESGRHSKLKINYLIFISENDDDRNTVLVADINPKITLIMIK